MNILDFGNWFWSDNWQLAVCGNRMEILGYTLYISGFECDAVSQSIQSTTWWCINGKGIAVAFSIDIISYYCYDSYEFSSFFSPSFYSSFFTWPDPVWYMTKWLLETVVFAKYTTNNMNSIHRHYIWTLWWLCNVKIYGI